jgi:uncharacterized protein YegP (UPF0339 family)
MYLQVYMQKPHPFAHRKQYRWRIVASNGREIANGGEGYYNLGDLHNALTLIKDAMGAGLIESVPVHERKPR